MIWSKNGVYINKDYKIINRFLTTEWRVDVKQILGNGQKDKEILDDIRKYINRYYKHKGKVPPKKLISEKYKITIYQVNNYLKVLTHLGYLNQKYCHYKPSFKKTDEEINLKTEIKKHDWILMVLRVVMFFIGIGAIVISVYYTTIWFDEFLDIILSIIFSIIMVAFSVGTFEVIIILKQNKQYLLIVPFMFLWIIVVGFSMMSTVAGQYNQRMDIVEETTVDNYDISYKREVYNTYVEEETRIKEQLDSKGNRLNKLNELLTDFTLDDLKDDKIKKIYDKMVSDIRTIENEMRILRNDLEEKGNRREEYLKENQEEAGITNETDVKRASFYEWIGDIFKVDAKYIEFWLSIIPALFVDIIAPLAVAVGMFLKRKEKIKGK
jgi:hypothetical protein